MKFDVVINTDNNYIQHCVAMLCSLYENNKIHTITLHVLQYDLSDKNKKIINDLSARYNNITKYYIIDENRLEGVQFRSKRPLSKAAYYRLFLSSILPKTLDKILYLDCDIIVLRDLSEIFNIEIDDYALAATLDKFPYTNQHRLQLHMEADDRTFCSGVMLVNLVYWRINNSEDKLLEYAHRYRKEIHLHDQDVLNYLFKKKWFLLPPKWNRGAYVNSCNNHFGYKSFDYVEYFNAPMLIHYAAVELKPWLDFYTPYKNEYVKYLKLSEFDSPIYIKTSLNKKIKLLRFNMVYYFKYMLHKLKKK